MRPGTMLTDNSIKESPTVMLKVAAIISNMRENKQHQSLV
jgi:hypothetical protein